MLIVMLPYELGFREYQSVGDRDWHGPEYSRDRYVSPNRLTENPGSSPVIGKALQGGAECGEGVTERVWEADGKD